MVCDVAEATPWARQLERPQEIGSCAEIASDSENLVDEVFNADNAEAAKALLDDGVVSERNTVVVDLAVPTLVDELTDSLQVGVATKRQEKGNATPQN